MRPDWSSLQTELLDLISKNLPSGVDHAGFRSVCTAWRAAAPRLPHLPWLYWAGKGPDFDWALHCFPDTEHRYRTPLPGGVFSGCSRGWIALHKTAGCLGLGDALPEGEAAGAALQAVEVLVVDEGLQSDQVVEVDWGLHSDQEVVVEGLPDDQVLEAFLVAQGVLLELVETEVTVEAALKVVELEEVASEKDLARNLMWK